MTSEPSTPWFEAANDRYRDANIDHKQRPFIAWSEYSVEAGQSLDLGAAAVRNIFAWFAAHAPPGAQSIRRLNRSAFFYDAHFWPVDLPVFYGVAQFDPFDCLRTMPPTIATDLRRRGAKAGEYLLHWAACVDFALSREVIKHRSAFSEGLLVGVDRELAATAALLLSGHPTAKAAHIAGLAVELSLKWCLAHYKGLTEKDAKHRYGHDLAALIRAASPYLTPALTDEMIERVCSLPGPAARYKAQELEAAALWTAYSVAQDLAARCLRTQACAAIISRDPT